MQPPKELKTRVEKEYGQRWECGGWGHPRRECPKFMARMGGNGGDVAALKGTGQKGKGGKGKGSKGGNCKWNGKGNYHYNYRYNINNNNNNNNYPRSLGKVIGKGLNNFDAEYWNVWGNESGHYWDGDENWWSEEWMFASGMNLMMMFERGSGEITIIGDEIKKNTKKEKQIGKHVTKTTGEFDSLRNIRRVEPIILKNKYEILRDDLDGAMQMGSMR